MPSAIPNIVGGFFPLSATTISATSISATAAAGSVSYTLVDDGQQVITYSTLASGSTVVFLPVRPDPTPPVAVTPISREDSEKQAWRMVQELLSAQEKRLLARYDYLPLKSRLHPGFTYRLGPYGLPPDVYYRGAPVGYLCIGFDRWYLPAADTFLMHKLFIEADEQTYLATANLSRLGDTPPACAWLDGG